MLDILDVNHVIRCYWMEYVLNISVLMLIDVTCGLLNRMVVTG